MDIDTLVRRLSDMGYVVNGYDSHALYLTDPSCVLLGFSTFMDYMWIILLTMAGFMLAGWGISMVRGAKNDIFTNLRNLALIFGILGAAIPIVNFIWGDDIYKNGCDTLTVPINKINEILDIANTKKMSTYNQFSEFERVDIYDSGAEY